MNLPAQLSKHFHDVYFGGNWTFSNLKDNLRPVNWKQATTKVHDFNTIAVLSYHIHYFVQAQIRVLQGFPLDAKDEYSFDHPPIENENDWENFKENIWQEAEIYTELIAKLPAEKLDEYFTDEKYGTYYRNIQGLIEHTHYHLGQIVIVKKLTANIG